MLLKRLLVKTTILNLACALINLAWAVETSRVDVGNFSAKDTSGWEIKEFAGITEYRISAIEGQSVLTAHSRQTASAYYKKISIDLEKTPFIHWSWRKELPIDPGNELEKPGDDFVARIYVVKSGGLFVWNTRAINYVWSFGQRKGDAWNNPFGGDKARMLALRDASDPEDVWFSERRNVAMDFTDLLGETPDKIDGVAIMTDSDNSGQEARAIYGDIYFSATGD